MNRNRKPGSNITIPPVDPNREGMITQVRRYKLITPLFGGGVETQKADPVTVVRATEVRGHLRFWWRATRGGQFDGDLEKMRNAEEAIWGSAAANNKPGPSAVSVAVLDTVTGTAQQKVEIQTRRGKQQVDLGEPASPYSYVAFPLRAERGKPAGKVVDGVEFTLAISYPDSLGKDVVAAIWAWETFGGIGARTRRGFGALECVDVDGVVVSKPLITAVRDKILANIDLHVGVGNWHPEVPHLLRSFGLAPANGRSNPDEAWRHLFDRLKKFRQSRSPDRNNRPYGRSKWPEPDAIRDITGNSTARHSRRRLMFNKFPRAAFGLPIIFQFKDANIGDPDQTSLEGVAHDRLASPLILRPLACAGGKHIGLAVILQGPVLPPNGLKLKGAPGNPTVTAGLTPSEARQIDPLDGDTDVLQAFLNWL